MEDMICFDEKRLRYCRGFWREKRGFEFSFAKILNTINNLLKVSRGCAYLSEIFEQRYLLCINTKAFCKRRLEILRHDKFSPNFRAHCRGISRYQTLLTCYSLCSLNLQALRGLFKSITLWGIIPCIVQKDLLSFQIFRIKQKDTSSHNFAF
ncbi:unnamed protein product [Moneuplotes crassus]|uniref:Uncharacterized protein n=1 Tax=Euplotes crassus TaxID=5936 RepID=A0AAD2CWM6_EUPCR|nr:unnamed protein product [Moneuplotes crassus]